MPAPLTMIHTDAVTPARAREALKAVAELNQPAAPDHWAVVVLREVLRQFEKARQGKHAQHEYECPGTGGNFSAAFASDHLSRCPAHFAVHRARAVADALRLAPEVVAALDLAPVEVDPAVLAEIATVAAVQEPRWARSWLYLPDDAGLVATLGRLTGPERADRPTAWEGDLQQLEGAIDTWERIAHRATDPCPFCGTVTELSDVVGHLLRCERHPAALLAERALQPLSASLGRAGAVELVGLVHSRNVQVGGLHALLYACNVFDGELGWNGEASYARGYVEETLRSALTAARLRISAVDREPMPCLDPVEQAASGPDFARPTWQALFRVGSDGPAPGSHAGTAEDGALLRAAYAEMLRLHEDLASASACAACGRHGVSVHRAVTHLAGCLAHPAVARRRAASAELTLAVAVLKERRPDLPLPEPREVGRMPINLLSPDPLWKDEDDRRERAKRYLGEQASVLDLLLSPPQRIRYASLVETYREKLHGPLSMWQRLRTAERCQCPWCGEAGPLDAVLRHLLACAAHPSAREADALEGTLKDFGIGAPGVAAKLQRQADRARIATARLLECALSFCSMFGDDERGRATISRSIEPAWNCERAVAKSTLEQLEAEAR